MKNIKALKRHEFNPAELSEKAFEEYSGSDWTFYIDSTGTFYMAESSIASFASEIGTLKDVEKLLEEVAG